MFKIAVLIVSLACASAGYTGAEQSVSYAAPEAANYYSAPSVSYSTFNRQYSPSLAYASPAHGYAYAAPVLDTVSHAYTAPLSRTYAAPALSYANSYAPSLSHQNYGYSSYAAPLATKTLAIAQPQLYHQNTYATHAVDASVLANRGFNYAPAVAGAHVLGYNNQYNNHHGHYAY